MTSKYYIVHPNGRSLLKAETDEEAYEEYTKHYTHRLTWNSKSPMSSLVRLDKTVLQVNKLKKETV